MRPEQLVWRCGGCGGVELGLLPPSGEAGDERRGETSVKHGRRRKATPPRRVEMDAARPLALAAVGARGGWAWLVAVHASPLAPLELREDEEIGGSG